MSQALRRVTHSPYSSPGRHAALLEDVSPELPAVSATAQNVFVHYRFSTIALPASSDDDINARWLSRILEIDQQRHGTPLRAPRPEALRVQGCCRDQTLLAIGVLRQHGIPARSRVGFADYLQPGRRIDHVVAEAWLDDRWVRFDPGLALPRGRLDDPHDIPLGPGSPFLTAAAAWDGYRRRGLAIDDLGVRIGPVELTGAEFVLSLLIMEVAHRFGDELLLWDGWGAMPVPGRDPDPGLGDDLARLVLAADLGDQGAEDELRAWYRADDRLHPAGRVMQFSPRGGPPIEIALDTRPDDRRANSLSREELMALREQASADPGLRADLARISNDTTDDLGDLR